MSRDNRDYYHRGRGREMRGRGWDRTRDRDRRDRPDFRHYDMHRHNMPPKRSRSPVRDRDRDRDRSMDKRRSRSPPRKIEKDVLDENILSEISKLPEPSELWDNQFQDSGYNGGPPPPSYQPAETVPNTSYGTTYPQPYSDLYEEFPSVGNATVPPPEVVAWNQMSLPPPPAPATTYVNNVEDQIKKEAAIETEMRHQKAALSKQREDYIRKTNILKKELDTLKDQRNELRGDTKRSPSPDTKRFLKENTKLQLEIQNKLKTINNVVDMLNGIIGEEAQELPPTTEDSPDRSNKRKSRSPTKFNYVYYDPEMHWCRVCNEFPPTAKDYLNHLHSPAHHKMAAAHMEAPWHSLPGVNEGFVNNPTAPTKRTPIRGLQFFVPSTAWYCKLCDQFIGDLHCASAHLKSITHSKNYTNFVEQNPHWETDWVSDRQKAFEKSRKNKPPTAQPQYAAHTITFNKDGFHTKRKDTPPPEKTKKNKEKKKKSKRKQENSSSSSSSSSSDSEPKKKSKSKKKERSEPEEKRLTDWMTTIPMDKLNDSDRKLLDTLKHRMNIDKGEGEKRRSVERSRDHSSDNRKRESERRDTRRDDRERDPRRDDPRRDDPRRDDPRRDDPRRDDPRRDDARREETRRREARRSPPETKKPEIKKMPFIGKMPVYKIQGKKADEQKKEDDQKKKEEEDEANKKRREEMDAEIQKKVAEFKEKIARAQLERAQQQAEPALPPAPPPAPLPAPLPLPLPLPTPAPAVPPGPPPSLPKDFQDALDIIFPTEVKPDLSQQDLFGMGLAGFPGFQPFPHLPLMQPPGMVMGFDINPQLFNPRPQLYDTHVPIVPSNKPRPQKKFQKKDNKNIQNVQQNHKVVQNQNKMVTSQPSKPAAAQDPNAKSKEELADLAMLGIDASDIGANM